MLILTALIFILPQNLDITPCAHQIRLFSAAANTAPNEKIIEAYKTLIHAMPLSELYDLQKNPLAVPKPANLTALSSYHFPFLELLKLIEKNFLSTELHPALQNLVSLEIEKKSVSLGAQASIKKFVGERRDYIKIKAGSLPLFNLMIADHGKILGARSDGFIIRLWNTETDKLLRDSENNLITIREAMSGAFSLNPDEETIYTHENQGIRHWNIKTGKSIVYISNDSAYHKFFHLGPNKISSIAPDPDGKKVYVAYGNSIAVLDSATGRRIVPDIEAGSEPVNALLINSKSRILFSLNFNSFQLWDITGDITPIRTSLKSKGTRRLAERIAVSRNGRKVYIYSENNIHVLDIETETDELMSSEIIEGITKLFISKHRDLLFTAHVEGKIKIWNLNSKKVIYELSTDSLDSAEISSFTEGSEGLRLYAGDQNGTIHAWYLPSYILEEFLGEALQ